MFVDLFSELVVSFTQTTIRIVKGELFSTCIEGIGAIGPGVTITVHQRYTPISGKK